jgi:tungstate transport system substrate-binding protein
LIHGDARIGFQRFAALSALGEGHQPLLERRDDLLLDDHPTGRSAPSSGTHECAAGASWRSTSTLAQAAIVADSGEMLAHLVGEVLRGAHHRLRLICVAVAAVVLLGGCAPPGGPAPAAPQPTAVPRSGDDREILLATTTSTQDSGLLDVLVPLFEQQTGYQVKTISIGTGAALALSARGEADVVLVHAPPAEVQWMAHGNGTERLLVMHNDFLVVGPSTDPARIKDQPTALAALKQVADARAPFVSRGDHSGTHQLELGLWQRASIDAQAQPWYIESGIGMGQTLTIADQRQAYTIADRATWLAFSARTELPIMVEGDPVLLNVYHVMPVNPAKFPNVPINTAGGKAFADFMIAPEAQRVIGEFGRERFGQPLFVPDAGKSEAEVGL